MYLFCNSRIYVITLYSGHVCVYYVSMLHCWHLIWILVRTDHPYLGVRYHTFMMITWAGSQQILKLNSNTYMNLNSNRNWEFDSIRCLTKVIKVQMKCLNFRNVTTVMVGVVSTKPQPSSGWNFHPRLDHIDGSINSTWESFDHFDPWHCRLSSKKTWCEMRSKIVKQAQMGV
jgi:hypothetical protein